MRFVLSGGSVFGLDAASAVDRCAGQARHRLHLRQAAGALPRRSGGRAVRHHEWRHQMAGGRAALSRARRRGARGRGERISPSAMPAPASAPSPGGSRAGSAAPRRSGTAIRSAHSSRSTGRLLRDAGHIATVGAGLCDRRGDGLRSPAATASHADAPPLAGRQVRSASRDATRPSRSSRPMRR